MPVVRELITKFGFDFDEKSAKKADDSMKTIKDAAIGIAAAFSAGAVGRALFDFVGDVTIAADTIAKTASKLGIATQALEELRHAAQISGVTVGEFDMNMERFTRRLGEAAAGNKEDLDTYRQLGIQIRDTNGRVKDGDAIFMEAAEAISQMETQAEKAAAASDLFGRTGIGLINMFEDGAEGVEKLRRELDLYGTTSEELIEGSVEWRDTLTRIEAVIAGVKRSIAALLLPAFQKLGTMILTISTRFLPIIKRSKLFEFAVKGIVVALVALGGIAAIVAVAKIGALIVALGKAAAAATFLGNSAFLAQLKMVAIGLAVLVLIGLLALLIEDFYIFATGGESLIGKLLEAWTRWIDAWAEQPLEPDAHWFAIFMKWIAINLQKLNEAVKNAFAFWSSESSSVGAEMLMFWSDFFQRPINNWKKAIEVFLGWLENKLAFIPGLGGLQAIARSAAELGIGGDIVQTQAGIGTGVVTPPTTALGGASVVNANRVQNEFNITQQPGQSSEELADIIAQKFDENMEKQVSDATAALLPAVGGQ